MSVEGLFRVDRFGQDVVSRLQQVRLQGEKLVTLWYGSGRDSGSGRFGKRSGVPIDRGRGKSGSLDWSDSCLRGSVFPIGAIAKDVDSVGQVVVGFAFGSESQSSGRSCRLEGWKSGSGDIYEKHDRGNDQRSEKHKSDKWSR